MKARLGIAVLALVAGCGDNARSNDEPKLDLKLLRDRIWIDHMPRSDTDKVHVFAVLSKQARRPAMGGFHHASMWAGEFEAFRYELNQDELRIVLPQSGDTETLKVKPTYCKDYEGGPDYCLGIQGSSRGAKAYISNRGWEIRSLDELEAKLKALMLK